MTRETHHTCPQRALRTAILRRALVRQVRKAGLFRGHLLRRLSQAVGQLPRPGMLRANGPVTTLTIIPSVLSRYCGLGLGLAGGGGGSPGMVTNAGFA